MSLFDKKVWDLTKKIPKGRVSTYKEIAKVLNTKACRAVGNSLRKNPFAPEVPCHRVVNGDGSLGGYKGKMSSRRKVELLKKEGVGVKNNRIIRFKKKFIQLSSFS